MIKNRKILHFHQKLLLVFWVSVCYNKALKHGTADDVSGPDARALIKVYWNVK